VLVADVEIAGPKPARPSDCSEAVVIADRCARYGAAHVDAGRDPNAPWLYVVCFLVLPSLPGAALALFNAGPVPIVRDRAVIIVLAALLAVLLSGLLAYRVWGRPRDAVVYGALTAALCVLAFFVATFTILALA
jgi:hypothetical protein